MSRTHPIHDTLKALKVRTRAASPAPTDARRATCARCPLLIVFAVIFVSGDARADLRLSSLPSQCNRGEPCGPFTIEHIYPDGGLWADVAAHSVELNTTPDAGSFGPAYLGGRVLPYSTSIASGASSSGNVYFFSRATVPISVSAETLGEPTAMQQVVMRPWQQEERVLGAMGCTLSDVTRQPSSLAAKEGSQGYLVTDNTPTNSGTAPRCARQLSSFFSGPNFYSRLWVRVPATTSGGAFSFVDLQDNNQPFSHLDYLPPDGQLMVWTTLGTPDHSEQVAVTLGDGAWHLVELNWKGCNGVNQASDITRELWVDGVLRSTHSRSLPTCGSNEYRFTTGVTSPLDGTFVGSIHIDSIRTSVFPLAARLLPSVAPNASLAECLAVNVAVTASDGTAALADGDLTVALTEAQGRAEFFTDPSCTMSGPLTLPLSSQSAVAYLRPTQAGQLTILATHPDYLVGSATLTIGATGEPPMTSIPLLRRHLHVGCSCDTHPTNLVWLSVGLLLMRRARVRVDP